MPTISTPSKIAGTRAQNATIHFSGSTSQEREAVVNKVIKETGATLIPPYDYVDVILGQGTTALETVQQVEDLLSNDPSLGVQRDSKELDAIITPCGGGGLLSGTAIALHPTPTLVFGAEPSHQGADDARRGVASGSRITTVQSLTIADGLRTPLGTHNYSIISNPDYVSGLYAVTEQNIKDAMRLVLERMKCFVEPSAVVGLATVLFNEEFRRRVESEGGAEGWNLGVVFSGGNTTVEALVGLFGEGGVSGDGGRKERQVEREEGLVGRDGKKVAENVAG
jgi:threonine dehydratase